MSVLTKENVGTKGTFVRELKTYYVKNCQCKGQKSKFSTCSKKISKTSTREKQSEAFQQL